MMHCLRYAWCIYSNKKIMTKKFACGLYFITVKIYHAKNLLLKKKKKRKKASIWGFMHISLPNKVIIVVVVFYFLALTNFCFLPVSCETKFISAVSVWLLHELPILNLYYGSLDCTNNSLILIGFLRLFEYLD